MSADYTNILIELNKSVKTLNFYPKGHPNLDSVIKGLYTNIKNTIGEKDNIRFDIDKKKISVEGVQILPNSSVVASLATQLFLKKIKALVFTSSFTQDEVRSFLEVISMDTDKVFAGGGGIERMMAKYGIKGILTNEMSYDKMAELEKEVKEEAAREEEEKEEPAEQKEESGEEKESAPEEEKEKPAGETLDALLKKIEKETDIILYNDLSARAIEKCELLINAGDVAGILPAVFIFFKHTLPQFMPTEEVRKKAFECYMRLLTKDTLLFLIDRVGEREEVNRSAIQYILLRMGDDVMGMLLDKLIEVAEPHKRRTIFNTIVYFGERIRPMVEERLDDNRWFVVRQMVSILGALGGEKSLDDLETAYRHKDVRVKKEALKSIARIPCEKATQMLLFALKNKDADRSLVSQAIISLGILRDVSVVDALGEITLKKETSDVELRKEAAKALGIIGDKKAIPYLTKLLFKKSWFSRDSNEELRTAAVISLSKIGGKEALDAIKEVLTDSQGDLYNMCKRILEGSKIDVAGQH